MEGLAFRLRGLLEVLREGRLVPLPPRQQGVLADLLLNANRVVPTDQLIWQIWDDLADWEDRLPITARNTIQSIVLRLRRTLDVDGATGVPKRGATW